MKQITAKPNFAITALSAAIFLSTGSLVQAGGIEEVLVTAQKREQSLNDVSLSVSAFGGDQMERLRIQDVGAISGVVAGLDITDGIGGTNPRISMRGVGLNDFNPNNNSSIGVYVDEVFQVSPATLGFAMFDLERVEVLKGPQGTLYGRNSNGGAINIVSKAPTEEFGGYAKVGYGNYENLETEGAVGGAIADNLLGRLSVRYSNQGETYYEGNTTGKDFGDTDTLAVRGQLATTIGEGLEALLKVEYNDREAPGHPSKLLPMLSLDGSTRCAPALVGKTDFAICDDALADGGPTPELLIADNNDDPWKRNDPLAASKDTDMEEDGLSVTLKLSKEFDDITLDSVTGYTKIERTYSEGNISEVVESAGIFRDEEITAYSQELRLSGSNDTADWVVGVFYSYDEVESANDLFLTDLFLTDAFWSVDQETTTAAVFANADWNLTDKLRLSTGLRYSWEEREFEGGTTDINTAGTSLIVGGPGSFVLSDVKDKITENDLSGRIGLDYRPNEDWLLYGNISTAFKSGGFFGDLTFANSELEPYDPENITAYEIGFKGTLADGDAQFNGSLFYYDYEDIQSQVPSGLSLQFTNVPEADVKGVELELQWAPTDAWYLQGSVTYLDTELSAFGDILSGNELPNAAELQYTGLVSYEVPVTDDMLLTFQVDFKYSDEMFREGTNDPLGLSDDYFLVNGSINLNSTDEAWELSLWGRNLEDEEYTTQKFVTDSVGVNAHYYGAPRTYGLSLRYKY